MAVSAVSTTSNVNNINTVSGGSAFGNTSAAVLSFPSSNGQVRSKEEVRKIISNIAQKYNIDKETGIKIVKSVCNQKDELLKLSDAEFEEKRQQIDDAFRMSFSKSNVKNTLKWFCNEPKDDNGFLNLLKASGCVSSDKKSLSDVSDSELKAAMEKLIKSPEMEKAFINFGGMTKTQKQEAIHKQVSYLEKLLANVSSNEKRRIYMIFSEITKESGAVTEGFRALIESFKSNKEELNKFLNEFTPSELAFIGVNQEDIALVAHLQTAQFESVDDARALQERIKNIAQNFRAEHKDELAAIEAKKNAQASGQQVEYTEKEQEILAILAKIEKSPLSGYLLGLDNSKIDEEGKNVLTSEALVYAEENGIKEDVLKGINTLYTLVKEEHPEYLSDNFDAEKFNNRLDKYTDGKYSQVVKTENNAESQTIVNETGCTSVDLGYKNKVPSEEIEDIRAGVQEKINAIAGTAKNTGTFVVEKQSPVGKTAGQIRDTYSSMMGFVRDALPKETYTNLTSSAHNLLITCLKAMPKTFSFYLTSQTSNTVKTDLAKEGIEVDVRGTDYYTKKQIEEIQNA